MSTAAEYQPEPIEQDKSRSTDAIVVLHRRVRELTLGDQFDFAFGGGCGRQIRLDNNPVRFQTPWCTSPFGISANGEGTKYSLTLNLSEDDAGLIALFRALDAEMLARSIAPGFVNLPAGAFERCEHHPLLRDNPQYAPSIKLKLPAEGGVLAAPIFTRGSNVGVTIRGADGSVTVPPRSRVRAMIELAVVWFLPGVRMWGTSAKALQIEVDPRPFVAEAGPVDAVRMFV